MSSVYSVWLGLLTLECGPDLLPLELGSLLAIRSRLVGDDTGDGGALLFLAEPADLTRSSEDKPDEDAAGNCQSS